MDNFLSRIKLCNIRSVEDALQILPDSYFYQYGLVYRSRSLQGPHRVDFMHPRAIVYGSPAKYGEDFLERFIITFNDEKSGLGSEAIEMMQFQGRAKNDNEVLMMREISFNSGQPQLTDVVQLLIEKREIAFF